MTTVNVIFPMLFCDHYEYNISNAVLQVAGRETGRPWKYRHPVSGRHRGGHERTNLGWNYGTLHHIRSESKSSLQAVGLVSPSHTL